MSGRRQCASKKARPQFIARGRGGTSGNQREGAGPSGNPSGGAAPPSSQRGSAGPSGSQRRGAAPPSNQRGGAGPSGRQRGDGGPSGNPSGGAAPPSSQRGGAGPSGSQRGGAGPSGSQRGGAGPSGNPSGGPAPPSSQRGGAGPSGSQRGGAGPSGSQRGGGGPSGNPSGGAAPPSSQRGGAGPSGSQRGGAGPSGSQRGGGGPSGNPSGGAAPPSSQRGGGGPSGSQRGGAAPPSNQRGDAGPSGRQRGGGAPSGNKRGGKGPSGSQTGGRVPSLSQRGGGAPLGNQRGVEGLSNSQQVGGGAPCSQRGGGGLAGSRIGRGRPSGSKKGSYTVEDYLHVVTDPQAALLTGSGNQWPYQEIKQKTGADVRLEPGPSSVPDTKLVIIRGSRLQIEAAVKLINQKTGDQETMSTQAQTFWLNWVNNAFPDLDSRTYFLPPVYMNRVPMTRQTTAGQDAMVLRQVSQSTQPTLAPFPTLTPCPQPPMVSRSDVRDDATMQRLLFCFQKFSRETRELLVGISQLQFGQYLGEPCYAAAAAQLPLPASLSSALPPNWKRGDFDVLLIHRHYGLVACEVKAFGDIVKELNMTQQDIDKSIRRRMKTASIQLDKAEAMLSHLVSDIAPGLRITKTIAVPNLTAAQVQQAVSGDLHMIKDLCLCLGTSDPSDITSLCLCSDQMSDSKTPWEVSSDVLKELESWWQRRVAVSGPDSHMTRDVYKTLVARFCGPASTVTVQCTSLPSLSLKTLGQAVSATGECYSVLITLFPEQIDLLNTAHPRLFVTGPPGTGKTVVLQLMGAQWLTYGHQVYIVSTATESEAACIMLHHLLLNSTGVAPSQLCLQKYNLFDPNDLENAVSFLSQNAKEGSLYIIADEVGPFSLKKEFETFCDELLKNVSDLHLWAASCSHREAPTHWPVKYFTRPLRSPPAIVREIKQDRNISEHGAVKPYSERGVPDHTDGPQVRLLYHRRQNHPSFSPFDCVRCGCELASFLKDELRVGISDNVTTTSTTVTATSRGSTPPCLQWRDVLVLSWNHFSDTSENILVKELDDAGIPVRTMMESDIEDVAKARSDVVWVARGDRVRGLERKIVICLEDSNLSVRLYCMSRCTSQLVIVSSDS